MAMHAADLRHRVHGVCTDLPSARAWMTRVCGPHELERRGSRPLRFEHAGDVIGGMATAVGCIRYGADVCVSIDDTAPLDRYSVSLPLAGEQELVIDGRRVLSNVDQGVVVAPSARQQLTLSADCAKLLVAIDRAAMHATLESMLGRPVEQPIVFEPLMSLGEAASVSWWRMVRLLWEDLGRLSGLWGSPALAGGLEESLLRGLLSFQPHNYSDELARAQGGSLPAHVARLREFLLRNAREDIRAADLVLPDGPGPQRLAADFRRHLGHTPLQFLRLHRLQQVRSAIVRSGSTHYISQIAMDWGFTHMGRFAQAYRETFGESPSATARRHRARQPGT